jgi:predicted ABC-class ATPase
LRLLLRAIDGSPYAHYARLRGVHAIPPFEIEVDRVPADPFAGPARLRVRVPTERAGIPRELLDTPRRRTAVEDFLIRGAADALRDLFGRAGPLPPGAGRLLMEAPGPAVLSRTACRVTAEVVELRLSADLPARGRTALGLQAEVLLAETLPRLATVCLAVSQRRLAALRAHVAAVEDHGALQEALAAHGLVAFVADGARPGRDPGGLLPHREAVPFAAPEARAVTLRLPHAGSVRGLGIPAGVTLLAGPAFHGKSALLAALAASVRPHPPGDGRERIAALPEALAVKAEAGRCLRRLDLSAFVVDLPAGGSPLDVSSDQAPAALAQAAAVVEALEAGVRLLLVDEDGAAPGFLVRDARMQRLTPRPPATLLTLLERARALYDRLGVSTVLATAGMGDYLEVAHTVLRVQDFAVEDVTEQARTIARATASMRVAEPIPELQPPARREGAAAAGGLRASLAGARAVRLGDEILDLAAFEGLSEPAEVRAVALRLAQVVARLRPGVSLAEVVEEVDAEALDGMEEDLARPRAVDVYGALVRWRALRVRRADREHTR